MVFLSRVLFFFLFLGIGLAGAVEKIDINTASSQDLQKINGIGPVLAERILALRENCYFYPLASLTTVKGIGEAILNKIEQENKAFVAPPIDKNITLCQGLREKDDQSTQENSAKTTEEDELSKIDINTAFLKDLTKIIHLGEARAQELIELRPFSSLDELVKIKGINTNSLQDIKDQKLAWVDPKLNLLQSQETKTFPEESTVLGKSFELTKEEIKTNPFSFWLIPLALALFSGATILILKQKITKAKG